MTEEAAGNTRTPGRALSADFNAGFWRLADPKISLTSAAGLFLGAAAAFPLGWVEGFWLLVLALAFFAMEVAKNAWGDVIDYRSGNDLYVAEDDKTDFSGGKRVLVDGLLTVRQTWLVAAAGTVVGFGLGLAIVLFREYDALWIGLIGAAVGWSYHGPPLKLAYRGLGELNVVLVYGPIVVLSTCLVLKGDWSWPVVWLSLPLGILIAAFLWINQFPDFYADRRAEKNNLVARLGKRRAALVYPLWYLAALLLTLALPSLGLPPGSLLGALFVPPAALAVYWVHENPESFHRKRPAQPMALLAFLLYALGAGAGLMFGSPGAWESLP